MNAKLQAGMRLIHSPGPLRNPPSQSHWPVLMPDPSLSLFGYRIPMLYAMFTCRQWTGQ